MRRKFPLIILAGCVAFAACGKPAESDPAEAAQAAVPGTQFVVPANSTGIVTARALPRALPDYLDLPAQLEPDPTRVTRVYAPAGGRLVSFQVRPGDRVQAGQTIALLESSDASAAISAYAKAQTDLQLKQQELARATDLYQHGAASQKDLQQAQADAEMAKSDVENARRQLRVLDADPRGGSDEVRITAPRSGVVLQTSAAAGEYSKSLDSSDPLCVIADLRAIWAVGDLLERDLAKVRAGDAANLTVVAFPGQSWSGKVDLISSVVDPATRTLKLRVVLANNGLNLRAGMFGSLRLLCATHTGLAIPVAAVLREGNADYLFVEVSSGRFERRTVTLGQAVGADEVEILSGLRPSEFFVTEGALLLRNVEP